jgi:bacillithiol biosynthesis cysteine-adding enzyme BshC
MALVAHKIPYTSTGLFSSLVRDYLNNEGTAGQFVPYSYDVDALSKAIENRKQFPVDRVRLQEILKEQYNGYACSDILLNNIALLGSENTFVITTAHQPNIFTGPLYFFYKIIHAIKLAQYCKSHFPDMDFVPVYYMGSEDADIEEVGSFYLDGVLQQWNTKQKGAVGRMIVDDALISLLKNIEGYGVSKPFANEFIAILEKSYVKGKTIAEATLFLVNELFGKYGLVVLQPDQTKCKAAFVDVMEKELLTSFSHQALQPVLSKLATEYHVQTEGREINLFYLLDNARNRIEKKDDSYIIADTDLVFSKEAMMEELHQHPEKFSPNVILRGVYQETLLPGIAFIGGGGELAYWVELQAVFNAVNVHYPILILRNSFAMMHQKQVQVWRQLGFSFEDLFNKPLDLEVSYVKRHAVHELQLEEQIGAVEDQYEIMGKLAASIDPTLKEHTMHLAHQAVKRLEELEKKMVRAERRKQAVQLERMNQIHQALFPNGGLQERVDNAIEWIGRWGLSWIDALLEASGTFEKEFTILHEEE